MEQDYISTLHKLLSRSENSQYQMNEAEIAPIRTELQRCKKCAQLLLEKAFPVLTEGFLQQFPLKNYGIGGKTLHRGVLCPSPILDIVIGKCSRGRLTDRKVKQPSFIYYYDSTKQLRFIETSDTVEYICWEDSIQYGVELSKGIHPIPKSGTIVGYSECQYSGVYLQHYLHASLFPTGSSELHLEQYMYESCLSSAEITVYRDGDNIFPPFIPQHDRYSFFHNNGYIDSYQYENLLHPERNNDITDRIYQIPESKWIPVKTQGTLLRAAQV